VVSANISETNAIDTIQYIKTGSATCNSSTNFSDAVTYTNNANITLTGMDDNGKYVCFKAVDVA
jgi:hypothetical protein